jgi:S1-C subfamily serine protease
MRIAFPLAAGPDMVCIVNGIQSQGECAALRSRSPLLDIDGTAAEGSRMMYDGSVAARGHCFERSLLMSSSTEWELPGSVQPKPEHYAYNLDAALGSVVGLRAIIPADAFTADTLGTERAGNGVLIRDGVVLTIGYLITEAQTIWIHLADGRPVPGHVLAYDQETGFGLVQALARLDLPVLPIGQSKATKLGDAVVVAGAGGRKHSVVARIVAKQEFAGNWEYVLDEAIFTEPAHPFWGGTAMIGERGELLGIGSLQVQQVIDRATPQLLNMIVPIDILKPILQDLLTLGRPNRPPRPWLGLNATEVDDKIVIARVSTGGPSSRENLRAGDIVLAVAGSQISDLAGFFRAVWSLGNAGVEVPLTIHREGRTFEARVTSGDRNRFLKGPSLH